MISVVESIWNLPGSLLNYNLATLTRQTKEPLEIIIVNASSDTTRFTEIETVCAKYPLVRMIRAPFDKFNLSRNLNVGIKAAEGEYVMLTAVDQLFSPTVLAEVYRMVSPNRVVQSNRADLPLAFDLGEADTVSERWDSLMAQAIPPTKFAIGAIICTTREWLHKVHGLDETRTPYNYCDSDLLERTQLDNLQAVDIGWDKAQVLHVSHPRNNPLYYGCGGRFPDRSLPIIRNLEGWGNVEV